MSETLFVFAALAAILLPLIGMMSVIGLVDLNRKRKTGFLHLAPYAILLAMSADVLFSGRSLDNVSELLRTESERSPINMWLVRLVTVFLLIASLERILAAARVNRHLLGAQPVLTGTFALFWLGSVGLNMAVSAHPYFAHEYFYSLVLGVGVLALNPDEAMKFVKSFRNALLLFLAAGFLVMLVKPSMVLESAYSQGYIPGLPRMSGLAPYAVTLGQLSLLALLLLIMYPLRYGVLQRVMMVMSLAALMLAQSKTAWISALICIAIIFWYRYKLKFKNAPARQRNTTLIVLMLASLLMVSITVIYAFGGAGDALSRFLSSSEGSQLSSLTGRDVIWDFALTEWTKYPVFGYGPQFLNLDQRLSIGMPNATHAHNQFVDLMARSGLVGLLSVFPYLIVVWVHIRKLELAWKGLAMAFLWAVLIRCISEVPLSLYGYGVELLVQLSLLAMLLASPQRKVIDTTPQMVAPHARRMFR